MTDFWLVAVVITVLNAYSGFALVAEGEYKSLFCYYFHGLNSAPQASCSTILCLQLSDR